MNLWFIYAIACNNRYFALLSLHVLVEIKKLCDGNQREDVSCYDGRSHGAYTGFISGNLLHIILKVIEKN